MTEEGAYEVRGLDVLGSKWIGGGAIKYLDHRCLRINDQRGGIKFVD